MELNTYWDWFLKLIDGQVRWQEAPDKDVFSAELRVVLRRDEMILDFCNAAGTKMNYKGPGVESLHEKVSRSPRGNRP